MGARKLGKIFALRNALFEVVALFFGGDKDMACAGTRHGSSLFEERVESVNV